MVEVSICSLLESDSTGEITMSVFLRSVGIDIAGLLVQDRVAPSPLGLRLEEMASAFEGNGKLFLFGLDGSVSITV